MEMLVCASCLGVVIAALALAAASDLASRIIPNGCVLAVALARVPVLAVAGNPGQTLAESVLGMATVLGFLLLSAVVSRAVTGSPGLGGGDLKLLAALGLWAGPVGGLALVGASCLIALAGRFACQRMREASSYAALHRGAPMPMAPAILLATLLALLAQHALG
ncbi:MAG: prepilin peptidase [Coriobacteriia bacterium]|nr:prepilin peptidase [Coriobacteriia bacterium]